MIHTKEVDDTWGSYRYEYGRVEENLLCVNDVDLQLPPMLSALLNAEKFSLCLRSASRCCKYVTSYDIVGDGKQCVKFDVYFTTPHVFGAEYNVPHREVALLMMVIDDGANAQLLEFISDDIVYEEGGAVKVDKFLPNLEKLWALILPDRLLPEAPQPPELTSLRHYQLRCVRWMMERECNVRELAYPLDIELSVPNSDKKYYLTRDFTLRQEPLIKMPDIVRVSLLVSSTNRFHENLLFYFLSSLVDFYSIKWVLAKLFKHLH